MFRERLTERSLQMSTIRQSLNLGNSHASGSSGVRASVPTMIAYAKAFAMIVSAGFTAPLEQKKLASTT